MKASVSIGVLLGPAGPSYANLGLTVIVVRTAVTDLRHSCQSFESGDLGWIVAAGAMDVADAREQALARLRAARKVWHSRHCMVFERRHFAVMVG